MKKKLLFVITQFYKVGAEMALLNLFQTLSPEQFEIDFLVLDQVELLNAESLLPQIPEWITVCDAAKREGKFKIFIKVFFKFVKRVMKKELYRFTAKKFVKGKKYDVAFSYGEWLSPEFIAVHVIADRKMIWIHTDIDKADYIDEKVLFGFDKYYTKYIFVSEHSKNSAEKRFSLLKGKTVLVHNMCQEEKIRSKALEQVNLEEYTRPVLLTVANLREEKNYKRQLEVMWILKKRKIEFTWLCIGSTANLFLYQQIKELIKKYHLEKECIFLGVQKNPYKFMARADAVMVLSDYESWSLVITEAKIIGIPVIATPTSGAKEQLIDKETGWVIPSFEADDIADGIEEYLKNPEKKEKIKENLKGFSNNLDIEEEFYRVLKER